MHLTLLMKNPVIWILLFLLSFGLYLVSAWMTPAYGASGNIKLMFFYREDCKWCRMMDAVLDDPTIKKILQGNVRIEKINIYGTAKVDGEGLPGTELKRKYGVFGIPTFIFISADNGQLLRIPGVLTKEDFKDLICTRVGIKSAFCAK